MRKTSISAHISRTARRFSTAIVPQFVKLDSINALSKRKKLLIRLADIEQLQTALKQYVLHNTGHFDPVDFEIVDEQNDVVVLTAQFQPEEFVVYEGARHILSILLAEVDPDSDEFNIAKIKHPKSGIKVYEMSHASNRRSCYITNYMQEASKCQFQTHSNLCRQLLSMCGLIFVPTYWTVDQEGVNIGKVYPEKSFFNENAVNVEWIDEADMEMRTLIICIGLVQMVREAFPNLMQIIGERKEQQQK